MILRANIHLMMINYFCIGPPNIVHNTQTYPGKPQINNYLYFISGLS